MTQRQGLHAFVVRAFGTRKGVDFDDVERVLIGPALDALGIAGRTTAEIVEAGNIREDMFQRLLTADLVIADVSIHNANVFYELGIRHALRDRCTFLLSCKVDEAPFDLRTDRYLAYDAVDPAASVPQLVAALRATLDSERVDSPVFKLLPKLQAQDRSRFLVVPPGFREEVRRARQEQHVGDLVLLAHEAHRFPWAVEGLRAAATALFELGAHEPGRIVWEQLRELSRDDLEVDARLGTIYQKLGDLVRSDEAIRRALSRRELKAAERAEFQALLGSNAKQRWSEEWGRSRAGGSGSDGGGGPAALRAAALASPWLQHALEAYERAFGEDVNHYYSGLNALALRTVQCELAQACPAEWAARFPSDDEAAAALRAGTQQRDRLAVVVDAAVNAARRRQEFEGRVDPWLDISGADLVCLTTCGRAAYVADRYRTALAGVGAGPLLIVRRQLDLLLQLGVHAANVTAALAVVDERLGPHRGVPQAPARTLVFTGHMIDAPDRPRPRFPARAEAKARAMIRAAVEREASGRDAAIRGFAGASSGGDTLFHEVCGEVGVSTQVLLAGPRDEYVAASVERAGPRWVERFDALFEALPHRVLGDHLTVPRWLRSLDDYGIWQRNNLWILFTAVAQGPSRVTLIALWNGEGGDGPGGTADMVQRARSLGAKVVILDAKELLRD